MTAQQAHSFAKVRRDHARETAEDYVEAVSDIVRVRGVCRVVDLARHMGVSHVTVTRTVARLVAEELLETAPYRPIRLTADGEQLAAHSRRRHETVLRFLLAIGVPREDAEHDSEGIEHHIGPVTLERIEAFLTRSSHNTSIPGRAMGDRG